MTRTQRTQVLALEDLQLETVERFVYSAGEDSKSSRTFPQKARWTAIV